MLKKGPKYMVAVREALRRQPAPPREALRVVVPSAPPKEPSDHQLLDMVLFGDTARQNGSQIPQPQRESLFLPAVDNTQPARELPVLGKDVIADTPGLKEETVYVAGSHPDFGRLASNPYTPVETVITVLTLPEVKRKRTILENPRFGRTRRHPAIGKGERKEMKKTYKKVEIQVFPERQFVLISYPIVSNNAHLPVGEE